MPPRKNRKQRKTQLSTSVNSSGNANQENSGSEGDSVNKSESVVETSPKNSESVKNVSSILLESVQESPVKLKSAAQSPLGKAVSPGRVDQVLTSEAVSPFGSPSAKTPANASQNKPESAQKMDFVVSPMSLKSDSGNASPSKAGVSPTNKDSAKSPALPKVSSGSRGKNEMDILWNSVDLAAGVGGEAGGKAEMDILWNTADAPAAPEAGGKAEMDILGNAADLPVAEGGKNEMDILWNTADLPEGLAAGGKNEMDILWNPAETTGMKSVSRGPSPGPVAVSTDGQVTVTVVPIPSPSSGGVISPGSDFPTLDASLARKSGSRGVSPRVVATESPKAASPNSISFGAAPQPPTPAIPVTINLPSTPGGANVAVPPTPAVGVQVAASPVKSVASPVKLDSPKVESASKSQASPLKSVPSSPKSATKAAVSPIPSPGASPAPPSSRTPNITSFVTGQSPVRAEALDSMTLQEVSSAAFHSVADTQPLSIITASLPNGGPPRPNCSTISFADAMSQVAGTSGKSIIKQGGGAPDCAPPSSSFVSKFFGTCRACGLFGKTPKLSTQLEADKDVQIILSNTPFNAQVDTHRQMLHTVYAFLTNDDRSDLPMVGAHWESVGFQSQDPAVDLNRMHGLLNLLHLLYLVDEFSEDARSLFAECKQRGLPFASTSIAVTALVLEATGKGKLNQAFNNAHNVVFVTCRFYVGVFKQFLTEWRVNDFGITDFEKAKKAVGKLVDSGQDSVENLLAMAPSPEAIVTVAMKS